MTAKSTSDQECTINWDIRYCNNIITRMCLHECRIRKGVLRYTLPITHRWLARRRRIRTMEESTLAPACLWRMSPWSRAWPICRRPMLRLVLSRDSSRPAAPWRKKKYKIGFQLQSFLILCIVYSRLLMILLFSKLITLSLKGITFNKPQVWFPWFRQFMITLHILKFNFVVFMLWVEIHEMKWNEWSST